MNIWWRSSLNASACSVDFAPLRSPFSLTAWPLPIKRASRQNHLDAHVEDDLLALSS